MVADSEVGIAASRPWDRRSDTVVSKHRKIGRLWTSVAGRPWRMLESMDTSMLRKFLSVSYYYVPLLQHRALLGVAEAATNT